MDEIEYYLEEALFDSTDALYTLFFGLIIFCLVAPTNEFITAGVTLETIFGRFLGKEHMFFVEYHLRRTAMVRIVYSSFVLLYFVFMRCLSTNVLLSAPNWAPPFNLWDFVLWIGIGIFTSFTAHTYLVWYANGTWSGHPTICMLRKIIDTETSSSSDLAAENRLRNLIISIDIECRHPDKFLSGQGSLSANWSGRRFLVTNSWILYTRATDFKIIKQSPQDLIAIVSSSSSVLDPSALTEGGRPAGENLGVQVMVTVRLINTDTRNCLLTMGLPANNLDELRAKLQCPLIRAEGVNLEPTVMQKFVEAFAKVVDENEPVALPNDQEPDTCIGCMITPSNVILYRRCDPSFVPSHVDPSSRLEPCGRCRCKPMWCLDCLARWFASRQTASHHPPSEWLSGRVPCPTCRTVFCARDVSRLITRTSSSSSSGT